MKGNVTAQRRRLAELDAIGRTRALTRAESDELAQLEEWREARRRAVGREMDALRGRLARLKGAHRSKGEAIETQQQRLARLRADRNNLDKRIKNTLARRNYLHRRAEGLEP